MNEMKDWSERVLRVVGPRGPYPHEYAAVSLATSWVRKWVPDYRALFRTVVIEPHEHWKKFSGLATDVRPNFDLLLHIWYQPRGYAGDGDLLTKLYRCLDTPSHDANGEACNPWSFSRWDSYIASRPETLAIQSRKEYLSTMASFCAEKGCTSFLDVACGVGEFTKQVYMEQGDRIRKVCGIDNDDMSITVAKNRNSGQGQISFLEMNVLKKLPTDRGPFDIIYSAGMFDYLNDNMFVMFGKKLLTLRPRYVIIGNIGQSHPTKDFMSCCGWDLFDRGRFDLLALGDQIAPGKGSSVETDRTGLQHFLRIDL
jgi:extracellular factor (EF) 3-hydroxypalmitic acid methyl ester biosynthesis protein